MNQQSSDLIGQRELRLEKVNKLREMGIDPYPSRSYETNTIKEIVDSYQFMEEKEVVLVGRIMSWRGHGKLAFMDLVDQDSKIQLYIKDDVLTSKNTPEGRTLNFEELNLLDIYDFVEAHGTVTKTQRGEISLLVKHLRVLAKTLRPLPVELSDKEERFRRRYVDMAVNKEVRERMKRRSLFWQAHRDFFNDKGFFEINTPVLEHVPGGGDAVPFTTHMNAINEDFFLRISHELPLKRLIGGGFEKVYDIGPRFRNEGLSDEHLPEHIAMEFYWAYAEWQEGMKLIQELYKYIIDKVYGGKTKFIIKGFEVDFSKEWDLIDFNQIFQDKYGIKDIYTITLDEVKELLTKYQISFDRSVNIARGVDALWKKLRKEIAGPAFLINHPKYLSPLQKASLKNPNMVERFQPIIAGSELGNGWNEVNDPIDQYNRFVEQQKLRDGGDEEAQWLDIDYVEMLEYGMPPTFGYGHAERVFWFLEDVTAREGVSFPQLRFELENITKQIYGDEIEELIGHKSKALEPTTVEKFPLINTPKLDITAITENVTSKYKGIKYGYVVLDDIKIEKNNLHVEDLRKEVESFVTNKYKDINELRKSSNISGFRELYKSFGADPDSHLNSAEALLRRVIKGKGLYNVNSVVDTYNATSMQFEIPMAAYNLDKVQGRLVLRESQNNEQIIKIGDMEPEIIPEGHLVYADELGVTCMDYNYRDADRTKITDNTNRIIVFVDGHNGITNEYIQNVLEVISYRLMKVTGGNVTGYNIVN